MIRTTRNLDSLTDTIGYEPDTYSIPSASS